MAKLPPELAEKHYKKLLDLYNSEYLTPAQKVSIFYHDLEHDILKKITGKKDYFEQFNWLKAHQIRVERNIKTGEIPKVIIDDIDNLKNWRNESVHENNMPKPKYISHFLTMAQTICFFSSIPIPKEIEDIYDSKSKNDKPKINNKNNWSGYYFVNTGISDDPARDWNLNLKYKFISGGNKKIHITHIKNLEKGDKIFAFITGKGYVGYGIVEEKAVVVKDFIFDKKNNIKMIDKLPNNHKWRQKKDKNIDEWIVKVDWKEKFNKNDAKWEKGLFANPNNVCKLTDKTTIDYLEKEFGIK